MLYPRNTGLPIGVLMEKHFVFLKHAIKKRWERRFVFVLENCT
jgi:hypothetical protein